jgi:hypothetical protein
MAPKRLAPSQVDSLPAFVTNRCDAAQQFAITVADTRGWLCQRVGGGYVPIPSAMYTTPPIPGHKGEVLHEIFPLFVCVPGTVAPGESTVVSFTATPVTGGAAARCETVVRVIQPVSVTGLPRPDFRVDVLANGSAGTVRFAIVLPEDAAVTLRLYDVRGRHVATLMSGEEMAASVDPHQHVSDSRDDSVRHTMSGATHVLEWNGRAPSGKRVPVGAYVYHVSAGTHAGWGSFVMVR